ncbi:hypothetical protein ECG_05939 [Echinococcus granulosus]|nr:hypothetical protein ECG_05939 [Echinococcus granulosus]
MYVVEIGQWECSDDENKESDFRHQCLLLFLYNVYLNFSLEKNSLETFIGPRDEQSVLRMALAQIKFKAKLSSEELDLLWIGICRQRLFCFQTNYCELVQTVEDILTTCNVIDRLHLLKAVKTEYETNAPLMETLHATEYLVVTSQLSWFESLVVSLLIEIGVPHLRFVNTPEFKPFHSLQLCSTPPERYTEAEPLSRALLAYLAVGVNIRNTIDLALIINKPFRGFSKSFFAILRHVAENSSILPGQLVLSYPACMTESAATSTLSEQNAKLLRPSSPNLTHLANTIRSCQDALSGYLSDDSTLAASSEFGRTPIRPAWPLETVKEAKGRLCRELEVLMSSPLVSGMEPFLTSTPNRPTHAGGSIQGRTAFRLARLFLLFEAAGQVAATRLSPSCYTPKTPLGQRTFSAFFQSPSSAETTPPAATATDTLKAEEDNIAYRAIKLVFGRDDLVRHYHRNIRLTCGFVPQQPKRVLHARYQSNLEWAVINSESSSPPVSRRQNPKFIGSDLKQERSVTYRPRLPLSASVKKPRRLFGDDCDEEGESNPSAHSAEDPEVKEVNPRASKSQQARSFNQTRLKSLHKAPPTNQPTILGFLKRKP